MIKEHFNKEKLKIDEENRMRHEINMKRKLYELKIRKDFEEKIRIRREMNERKIMEEGPNGQVDNVDMVENHHKEDIHVDEVKNGGLEGRQGDGIKGKEVQYGKATQREKQKGEKKVVKSEQKKNIFEDYSSDGSYYKYMYRNLYEETWNNKMKSHYHDVGDNFYLQDCSDNFFLNAKAHSSVADSLSNSFDNELISLSRIKFDDFDYNYLNEVNRSVLEKKRSPRHSRGARCSLDGKKDMGRNPNLLKPKVIFTDSEESPRKRGEQGNTHTSGGDKNGSSFSDSSLIKRRTKRGDRKSSDCFRIPPDSTAYKKNDSENILNKLLLIKRQNRAHSGEPLEEVEADEEMESDREMKPDEEMESDREVEPDEEIESDREMKPDEEMESDREVEPDEEIESDREMKPDEEMESDREVEPDEEIESNREMKPDEEMESDREMERNEEIEPDGETEVDEENKTNMEEVTLENDPPEEESVHLAQKKQTRNKPSSRNDNNTGGYSLAMERNSSPGEEHSTGIKESNLRETDVEKERKVNEWRDKNRHKNHSNILEDQQNKMPNKSSGSDESEDDEKHLKHSLSSSDNGIPKINILNNRENYIPLDVALNFVIDNEKLKKTNVKKEHKGSQKKKTFVQWLMDERKKRLKNNLPIDI